MISSPLRIYRTGGESRMTWWGALGLALSLYGVVVLLEWVYDYVVRTHAPLVAPISLVMRVTDQEAQIEHVIRAMNQVFKNRQWGGRAFEVILFDAGSSDRTRDIIERFSDDYPYYRIAEVGSTEQSVLQGCRYPLVLWIDLSRHANSQHLLELLMHFLTGLGRA